VNGLSESLEEAKRQKLEQYQQEMESKKKGEQVKAMLRMALSENAYERLMNVKLANAQLYGMAANQVFGLYQKSGRKLTEKELISVLKAIKGSQREPKITFK
jgi:DNA-binding TFAR19-related protein (PDSD5 family)